MCMTTVSIAVKHQRRMELRAARRSATDPLSPSKRTQEAYKQKQKQRKLADQRTKREKSRRTAAASKFGARTMTNNGLPFKKGGERKTKSEFLILRGKYHATGTKAAKAERVKTIEQMLEDDKSDE